YTIQSLHFFFQAEDGIRDRNVTGVQTCALPICLGLMLLYATPPLNQRRLLMPGLQWDRRDEWITPPIPARAVESLLFLTRQKAAECSRLGCHRGCKNTGPFPIHLCVGLGIVSDAIHIRQQVWLLAGHRHLWPNQRVGRRKSARRGHWVLQRQNFLPDSAQVRW